MRNIDEVVYHVKMPLFAEIREKSYSLSNFVLNFVGICRFFLTYLLYL